MTGRRLYDYWCDAQKAHMNSSRIWDDAKSEWRDVVAPVAWPFLPNSVRGTWNALARRITPKPKARS